MTSLTVGLLRQSLVFLCIVTYGTISVHGINSGVQHRGEWALPTCVLCL
jgi:hypothetical protein